jgi:GntR family transcriptional repressor for pyruvate dehydrogenase complex
MQHDELRQLRLEYEILSCLAAASSPVGATTLVLVLGEKFGLSQASIGRKLMEFDAQGLTLRQGKQGRVLIPAGQDRIMELQREIDQRLHNSNLIEALNSNDEGVLLDVLVARRALERETAALASLHATAEDIAVLRRSIALQDQALSEGRIPYDEDQRFHMLLAQISRNKVLLHALRLVWGESIYPPPTAFIRHSVGSELVVDHRQIVDCIAGGSPVAAADAMVHHINQLIKDVHTYFVAKLGTKNEAHYQPAIAVSWEIPPIKELE